MGNSKTDVRNAQFSGLFNTWDLTLATQRLILIVRRAWCQPKR